MGKVFYSEDGPSQRVYVVQQRARRYGFFGFMFDIIMTFITGGFWLIWVFVREMRKR